MNPSELIVICALGLPMNECRDLFQWYLNGDSMRVKDESIQWWIHNHAKIVAEFLAGEYRTKYRRY